MHRNKLDLLTLLGFGLILLSFFVRGFGQFLVGQRRALEYAGPIAVVAGGLLVVAAVIWTLDRYGVVALEE